MLHKKTIYNHHDNIGRFWKEKIAISVKLHLQGGYNFCVAVTDNVNHGLLPFFLKGSMHFPLFIIAPIGFAPVYSHGLR